MTSISYDRADAASSPYAEAGQRCVVLFLTTILPGARRMGSEVATQAVIDGLRAAGAEVDVLGYVRQGEDYEPRQGEMSVGRRHIETSRARGRALIWMAESLVTRLPYSAAKYRSRAYVESVRERLSRGRYDFVVLDHAQLGWLLAELEGRIPVIMMAHNVESEMYRQLSEGAASVAGRMIYAREATLVGRLEHRFANAARGVWTLTQHDAAAFRELRRAPGGVTALALPATVGRTVLAETDKAFDIGLIGSWSWKANREALDWFLAKVRPLLPETCTIHVAGGGAAIPEGRYPNIVTRGFVPDAQVFLSQARVVAIPTLSGGGIQIKTLDAIASGSRVVGTPVALRGIECPPATVRTASGPAEFAAALVEAISAPPGNLSREAADWTVARQERFAADIVASVRDLTHAERDRR